jgi:hypothetical protein
MKFHRNRIRPFPNCVFLIIGEIEGLTSNLFSGSIEKLYNLVDNVPNVSETSWRVYRSRVKIPFSRYRLEESTVGNAKPRTPDRRCSTKFVPMNPDPPVIKIFPTSTYSFFSKIRGRIAFAGVPTQTVQGGKSRNALLRAPSTAPSPMVTPGPTKVQAASHDWLRTTIGAVIVGKSGSDISWLAV